MKRRTYVLWKRILTRGLILFFILGIFALYFKSSVFSIRTYDIQGVDDIRAATLMIKFKEIENERIWKIFPGNSIFTYHRKAIKRIINETLPNTASLSIFPPSFHTLRVVITSHQPIFKKNNTEAITSDGTVYKEINDISNLPTLEIASSSLITPKILISISTIYPKISASIFPVTHIYFDENRDVHIKGGAHMSDVIIDGTADMDKVWSNLVSAIDTDPLKSKLELHKDSLEYLDARFGNKVFYKFTNANSNAIITHDNATTSTATSTH